MSTTTKPTILLVPGSFAPPSIYSSLITLLRNSGFPAVALQLPSTQKRMPLPPASMLDDADVIKRAVETLIGMGREVVVACHSYGGTPTTQALAGLGVKRLIYLSAIVPKVGQSQMMAFGAEEGSDLPVPAVDGYMHIDAVTMAGAVCNDLPWDLAYENVRNFAHHSGASFQEKITLAAYPSIPVTYIVCENDLVVPPQLQRSFINVLEEAGAKVEVKSLESGHAPNWSMPEKLAEVIAGEAEKA